MKEARVGLQLTQEMVALGLRVRQSEVSRWESGRCPRAAAQERIARFFRIPTEVVATWWPQPQHRERKAA